MKDPGKNHTGLNTQCNFMTTSYYPVSVSLFDAGLGLCLSSRNWYWSLYCTSFCELFFRWCKVK